MICVRSGMMSSSALKCSTGSSSAMSGRSSGASLAAISAISRCSGASSAAGEISTQSVSPRLRWVKVENQRSASISMSNRSTRTARSSVGGIDVEQAAADGELPALLDLVGALVAGGDEVQRDLLEVDQVADAQHEPVRAQLRVRHLLGERRRGHHHDRLLGALGRVRQRVQRGHAQADEVRRRLQVGLVGDAAARVVADRARRQPRLQIGGEITRGTVVADDDQRRALRVLVRERGHDERAQRLRDERRSALVGQLRGRGVVFEMAQKGAEQPVETRRATVMVVLTKTVFELFGEPVSWAELFGFITGIACVALAVAQRIETFPVGIANNVFFVILFTDARLFADAALQIVFIVLGVMGWWVWATPAGARRSRSRRAGPRLLVGTALGVGVATLILIPILRAAHGAAPGWDAADDVDVARRAAAAEPQAAGDVVRVDRRGRDLRPAVLQP